MLRSGLFDGMSGQRQPAARKMQSAAKMRQPDSILPDGNTGYGNTGCQTESQQLSQEFIQLNRTCASKKLLSTSSRCFLLFFRSLPRPAQTKCTKKRNKPFKNNH